MAATRNNNRKSGAVSMAVENVSAVARIGIRKTYKLYIDGKFPRTESGRVWPLKRSDGTVLAQVCKASRKDLRDSIVSNRKAWEPWAKRSAYNRGQILYRIAETLEGRRTQFVERLVLQGLTNAAARREVDEAIDLLVYYAGWCDKYTQVFSAVNPVESAHFNFSYPEPLGVVTVIAPSASGMEGLVASLAPLIAGGNCCTVIAAEGFPLTAVEFAEVIHASDVPAGVVNILTGEVAELLVHASSHMDVNGVVVSDLGPGQRKTVRENASLNVKRVIDFSQELSRSPYRMMAAQEIKTTWHPVAN